MDSKITNFNFMMLDTLRNEVINHERLEVLLSLYLIGYTNQLGQIDVDEKIKAIDRYNDVKELLVNIFEDIKTKYPILISPLEEIVKDNLIDKVNKEILSRLVKIIAEVPFNREEWKNAVEHLVKKVSDNSRLIDVVHTPISLNKLGIEILNPLEGSFYDGTAGTNGTIICAKKYAEENSGHLKIYAQELNQRIASIGIIRAFINGIDDLNFYIGDTLMDPGFKEENSIKKFDRIFMDIPFGQSWGYYEYELLYDKYSRYVYGKPTKSNSEWLFVSHMIKSLKEKGKGVALVTSSSLFNRGTEEIRKNIIEDDIIEAVIGLPSGLFSHTSISANMIVINKNKKLKNKILFINAEDMVTSIKRLEKEINDENIYLITNIYKEMNEVDEISRVIDINEIENYMLIPNRYISKTEVNTDKFGVVKIKHKEIKELKSTMKFSKIASFYRGISTSFANLDEENGEYKIIKLSDVQDGQLNLDTIDKYNIKNNAKIDSYKVKEGDIIISAKGATIKTCIIPKLEETILISQSFIGIRMNKGYSVSYIKEYLESPLGRYLIESKQLGSTIAMLNAKDLKDIDIVIHTKEVQDEIINQYKNTQDEIKEKIKRLEQEEKELQLELYKKMGILNTMEIMGE